MCDLNVSSDVLCRKMGLCVWCVVGILYAVRVSVLYSKVNIKKKYRNK